MATPEEKQRILLESGTNEVEIAEIVLSGQRFGVNVAKIREFIPYEGIKVSRMPGSHPSILGVFLLRGKSIPFIDLVTHLNLPKSTQESWQVVVVTEFNNMVNAFYADEINRIHRVSWSEFKPLNQFLADNSPQITGSISLEGNEVLILDLEHIIGEIFPESIINYDEEVFSQKPVLEKREEAHVIFAEDSAIIRYQITNILEKVGYNKLSAFDNGLAALQAIKEYKRQADENSEDIRKYITLVITDIEMPQMDGLSLCRQIKQELGLKIPVIMFSSLINEQMARKCEAVGADAFVTKPETEALIDLMDRHCFPEQFSEGS